MESHAKRVRFAFITDHSNGESVELVGRAVSDLIISAADALQKAEPVPEGIAHHSDATPSERSDVAFKFGAGRQRALHRSSDIVDFEVQVYRLSSAAGSLRERDLRRCRGS